MKINILFPFFFFFFVILDCWWGTFNSVNAAPTITGTTIILGKSAVIIPPRGYKEKYPGINVPFTTNKKVPNLFREKLNSLIAINESISDRYPAAQAVEKLEKLVGWNVEKSTFDDPSSLKPLANYGINGQLQMEECTVNRTLFLNELLQGDELHKIMDIVIPTIRDLDFLESWKVFIEKFHIILIQDGDPEIFIKIPHWVDYELYNRLDIEKALGERSWIISQRDASIRNFGFLVSAKRFIWSLDDDCFPAQGPGGDLVNAIQEHAINLLTPSTPYFFNTVYDPYRQCSDFVRGYPFSLRKGVQTAVSHGLWMNMYDYDAPTQLLKPGERNRNYADITLTIPNRILYPLCSMNVAFNRELIGPGNNLIFIFKIIIKPYHSIFKLIINILLTTYFSQNINHSSHARFNGIRAALGKI